MVNFIVDGRKNADKAVTQTYNQLLWDACLLAGETVGSITKGQDAENKKTYIVTDTIQAAFKYICKGYKNHIVWMQGIVPEESFMRRHSYLRFWAISAMERLILKKAKLLLLVSEEMLQHYEKKYHLKLKQKSIIMPCFNELGIEESAFCDEKYRHNTFTYVGSIQAWQCFEQTAKLYREIEARATTPVKFCVYTFQQEAAEQIIKNLGIQNYAIDCVPPEELSQRIKEIKYGFIIRENHPVNNVATPTKFSNYLANGIIPIYSSAVKAFAAFDKKNQLGLVYDLDDPEAGLRRILEHMEKEISAEQVQEKCTNAFAIYYNAEMYKEEIAQKLKQIMG